MKLFWLIFGLSHDILLLHWGGGHSDMSANIICMYNDPLFTQILHPMTPFFTTVHTQWTLFQNFNVKFQICLALNAQFKNFVNFKLKKANFHSNLTNLHQMTSFLTSLHQKRPNFVWIPHPMTPFFLRNPTLVSPMFLFSGRCIPVTFIFECPPPRPGPTFQDEKANKNWLIVWSPSFQHCRQLDICHFWEFPKGSNWIVDNWTFSCMSCILRM